MNLFRTLRSTGFALFVGLGLSSCLQAPDYAIEPAIDFNGLSIVHVPPGNGLLASDTLKFSLNFRDGDGDLGLSDEDIKVAPWNTTTGGQDNRGTQYNYFIQPFLKDNTGRFVPFTTPSANGRLGEYNGRFLRLDNPEGKPMPLRGELRYKLPLSLDGAIFLPRQVFRFEISILDRGLHQSNKITTTEVTLGR